MADLTEGGGSALSWVQLGGVGLFAASVLLYLRDMKRELAPTLTDVQVTLAALLERDRMKSERTAAQQALASAQARAHAAAAKPSDVDQADSGPKLVEWPDDEHTHPLGPLPVKHRARTSPYGVPSSGLHGPRRPRQDS